MKNEADNIIEDDRLAKILQSVRRLPRLPGVYLMKSADGAIIYIGKAKSLKERVRAYFNESDNRAQIRFLIKKIDTIETIVTGTEEQAFILERDLINRHKPRYNIRLKDDKSYLSIRLDENAEWPRLELVRKVKQDDALYYGPYSFTYELRSILDIINKTIPLRTCSDTVLYNRQRPCLEYQIKRCAAPCCLAVDRNQYDKWILQARSILEGKTNNLIGELTELMELASDNLDFEKAAELRDKIGVLESFGKSQTYISPGLEDRDVFAIHREESFVCVSVLLVRYGRISDSRSFALKDVHFPTEEVLSSVIEQFYTNVPDVPPEIVLPKVPAELDFLREHLKKLAGRTVLITVPQKGIKYRLLKLAELNAKQHFSVSFERSAIHLESAQKLAQLVGLKQIPRRIECVDISNLQGSDIVGAIVSFFDGVSDKSNYRRYKISQQGKPDDFAAIYEVISRRLKRASEEASFPDLIIVDGGRGQLDAALKAARDVGVAVDMVGLAKERSKTKAGVQQINPERIFLPSESEPIELPPSSELTNFVARIRDEVHRFVITYHRQSRSRRVVASVLDEISGLGPERKQRLLKAFGSVENIRHVAEEELARQGRMPLSLAKRVKLILNDKSLK